MPRLTDKTELAESPASGDLVHVVDISDTTGSAEGTSKKIQAENLSPLKKDGTDIVPYTDGDDLNMKSGNITSSVGENSVSVITDENEVEKVKWNSVGPSFVNGGNTAFGGTTPNALVDIAGSVAWKVRTIAAATGTLAVTDNFVAVDYTSTGTVALALPSAASAWNSTDSTGIVFTIADIDANANTNNITLNRDGSDTIIDTAAGQTSTVIGVDGGVIHIVPISSTVWKVF